MRCEEDEVGGSTSLSRLTTFCEIPDMYLNSIAGAVEIFLQVCFFYYEKS